MKKTKEATPIAKKSDDTGSKEILDDQGDNARTPVQSESEISRAETTPNLSGKQRTSAGDIQNGVRVVASAKVPRVMSFNNMSSWGKSSSSKRQDSAASSVSAVESEVDTGEGDTINVVVRVRPLSKQEQEKKDGTSIQFPGEGAMWMDNNGSTRPFTFNVVFEPEASQQDVFDHSGMMKLIDMAINGYSCTTFAFGQTGSGKTHTITGPPQLYQDEPDKEHELYGLIPRSFRYLMKQIGDRHLIQSASTFIRASYLEIYNEQVIDLLNPNQHGNLQVRWSKNKGFYVENLFVIECETLDDLFAVLEEEGSTSIQSLNYEQTFSLYMRKRVIDDQRAFARLKNRQTGSHNLNEFSSRSHSMLSLMIDSEMQDPDDENVYITKHGKLTFVDLAGSEKVKDSQSSGEQLIETNNINRSLLVLGNCISSLGDPKKRNGHIPYRDSKLTKLLADSLGGNGVTLMIACVSPASSNAPETMNTLRYANRAKKIKNKPVVKMDPREKLIISLKRELKLLRTENHYLREQLHFPSTTQGKHIGEEGELLQVSKLIADETSKDPFLALEKKEDGKDRNSNLVNRQDTLTSIKSAADSGLYEMLQEYMIENETLRSENTDLTKFKEEFKREHQTLSRENDKLIKKLDDLERAMSAGSFHPFNNAFNGYRRRSDNDYYYPSPDLSLSLSSTPMLHSSYNSFLSEQNYASSPNGQRSARQSNDLPPVNPMRSGAYQHNAQQVQRPRLYQGQSNSPPGMPAQSMRPANRYPPPRLSPSQGYAGVGPMSTSPRAYQGGVNGGPVQVGSNPVMYPGPPGATWPPGNGSGPGNATQRDYAPRQSYRGPQNQQQNYNSSRAPPMGAPNHEYYGADNNIVNGQGDVPSKGPGGYKSRVQKPQEQINVNNPLRDSQTVLPNQSNIPPNGRNETQTIPKKTTPRQAKGEAAQKPSSYAKLLSKKSPGAVESKVQPTPRDNTKDNTPYEEIQDMNEKLRQELADLEGEIKQHQRLIDPKPAGNGKR